MRARSPVTFNFQRINHPPVYPPEKQFWRRKWTTLNQSRSNWKFLVLLLLVFTLRVILRTRIYMKLWRRNVSKNPREKGSAKDRFRYTSFSPLQLPANFSHAFVIQCLFPDWFDNNSRGNRLGSPLYESNRLLSRKFGAWFEERWRRGRAIEGNDTLRPREITVACS